MSHIKNIEIKNFKSIRHATIEDCRRVNVFIGYPNTGKSNLLEAIGLFCSLNLKNDYFRFNDICRAKHFSELFFNKDYKEATNITINNKLLLELIINEANDLDIRIHNLDNIYTLESKNTSIFSATVNVTNNKDFSFRVSKEPIESEYKSIVETIRKYEFKNDGIINQQRPFTLSVPFGANLLDILQRDSNLRKEIAGIFDDYNLKLFIDGDEIKFLKYLSDGTGVSIPYHQIADTLRRLVFYKAAIYSNKNSVLLFEEPEAHMFPPYISKFTGEIVYDENDNQFFLTTHSPFVLNDLIKDVGTEELALFIVTYDKVKGETIVHRMNDSEMHEAYQFGYDFFMNINQFIQIEEHE